MKKYLSYPISAFLLAIALFSCQSGSNVKKGSNVQAKVALFVEGFIVKPSVLDQTISVSGTLKPFEETVLMPDITGRIVKINLTEGKPVKQGTVLIKLFDDDLQAELLKSQAQLKIAEKTQERQSELIKVEGMSQIDFDQTKLQVNSIKGDIEVIKAQIRKTEVIAPFTGVIGLRNVSLGAIVTPATALATIREIDQMKLDFSVPEKYSKEIKSGTKVSFTVQGDDKKYEAVVMATEEGIELSTRNLKARAIVNSATSALAPGSFANVEIRLHENKNALLIPTQVIIPQERNKNVIVCKNGKALFVTVKTGVRQSSNIEILSGIEPGDTVVTTGIQFIKPGAVLNFSKVMN
jgi:membrane fusion protein (multidrug efflux system)